MAAVDPHPSSQPHLRLEGERERESTPQTSHQRKREREGIHHHGQEDSPPKLENFNPEPIVKER